MIKIEHKKINKTQPNTDKKSDIKRIRNNLFNIAKKVLSINKKIFPNIKTTITNVANKIAVFIRKVIKLRNQTFLN